MSLCLGRNQARLSRKHGRLLKATSRLLEATSRLVDFIWSTSNLILLLVVDMYTKDDFMTWFIKILPTSRLDQACSRLVTSTSRLELVMVD